MSLKLCGKRQFKSAEQALHIEPSQFGIKKKKKKKRKEKIYTKRKTQKNRG